MRNARAKTKKPSIPVRRLHPATPAQRELAITRDVSIPEKVEKLLLTGDLKELAVEDRLIYVNKLCKSLGLNPLTQPFQYLVLQGRMVLYATRTCTEQLRKIHGVSVTHETRKIDGEHCIVDVEVQDRTGRTDTGTGVVWIGNMKGNDYANALMKASTKAKRRATLSIVGLGFLDESELDTLQGKFKMVTPGGRIIDEQTQPDSDAENPYLQHYKEREKKELKKLTPAQREVVERKMKSSEAGPRRAGPAGIGDTNLGNQSEASQVAEVSKAHSAEMPTASIPCLFYTHVQASDTYLIDGAQELKTANKDLLGPLWNPVAKAIVATPSDLGRLISQFEERRIPFRELKSAVEKGRS